MTPWAFGACETVRYEVDADDGVGAEVLGDSGAHLADRPEPEHEHAVVGGDVGVLDGLPGGGEDVGEKQEAIVRRAVGDLDRAVVGLRDAQELGLSAGDLAVELRVAQ